MTRQPTDGDAGLISQMQERTSKNYGCPDRRLLYFPFYACPGRRDWLSSWGSGPNHMYLALSLISQTAQAAAYYGLIGIGVRLAISGTWFLGALLLLIFLNI